MPKFQAIINTLSVVFMLFINYYSQTGKLNNRTIGELSDQYQNLFTPAGYAFSIWGIIFIGLIAYVVNQLRLAFSGKNIEAYQQTGYWLALVNLGNAAWVVAWIYEYTGLSVLIMLFIITGLLVIVVRTNMERWDAPLKIIAFVWWPICLYAGWISVATIANIAAYLSKLSWNGGFLSDGMWTVVMIAIAVGVNTFMIWNRSMREFALVGIWALMAIYVRHLQEIEYIAYVALAGAIIILVNVSVHGYRNRATNPFLKW